MKYKILEQNHSESALFNILNNRGITDPNHYLHTTNDDINSPLLLGEQRLQKAAKMLTEVIQNNEDAYIISDGDCDGFTSAAILTNYLYRIFPDWVKIHLHIYIHEGKQHGLADCIDFLLEKHPALVIVPDAGSNDFKEHKRLYEAGIMCFCLDHHNADIPKDYKYAVIINNNCNYLED